MLLAKNQIYLVLKYLLYCEKDQSSFDGHMFLNSNDFMCLTVETT